MNRIECCLMFSGVKLSIKSFVLFINEYMMLLKDLREPLLSFELIYFTTSFCYRIENS